MNITNNYNTNFTGGFRFPNMSIEAKDKLPELVKKKRQIFNDFENQGDVFFVVRDFQDKNVLEFIKDNNLKFEYYPQISTKSGLDTEKPEILSQLLQNMKPQKVKTLEQAKKIIKSKISASKTVQTKDSNIETIFKALKLDIKNPKTTTSISGCKIIEDPETGKKVWISPESKYGINYVLIEPKSLDFNVERYAISKEGEVIAIYNSPDGINQFKKNFNATLARKYPR